MSTRPLSASCTIAARSSPRAQCPRHPCGVRDAGRHLERHPSSRSSAASTSSRAGSSWRIDAEQRRLGDLERSRDVGRRAGAARRDHGHRHGVGDLRRQLEVVAGARAVCVDRREQDLPGASPLALARPRRGAASVGAVPACERTSPPVASIGETTACDPSRSASSVSELGLGERRRVDRHLVGTGFEQRLRVGDRADSAADRERDRQPPGHARTSVDERPSLLDCRRDVQEDELVRAGLRVRLAELDGIAHVAQLLEVHALDHAAAGHVEARDQTRERHTDSRKRAPAARSSRGGTGRR